MIIKNRSKNDKEVKASLLKLSMSDLDDIVGLQDFIIDGIVDKQIFARTSREEFISFFEGNSCLLGLRVEETGKLVALGVYLNNGSSEENYGYDLEYSKEDILKTGQVEITIVHPDFRGNRLQGVLCKRLIEVSKENGDKYLTATVSPYNKHSLNNFFKLDFKNKKEKLKYGGVLRCILEYKH
ncbi:MAG: GNAT family N-acetyltransferase [Sarcina sp.]